jgi:hypothetical protein
MPFSPLNSFAIITLIDDTPQLDAYISFISLPLMRFR